MAKFSIEVEYTCKYKKTLNIYASDAGQAEEKAHALVESWSNVVDVEILDVDEE